MYVENQDIIIWDSMDQNWKLISIILSQSRFCQERKAYMVI